MEVKSNAKIWPKKSPNTTEREEHKEKATQSCLQGRWLILYMKYCTNKWLLCKFTTRSPSCLIFAKSFCWRHACLRGWRVFAPLIESAWRELWFVLDCSRLVFNASWRQMIKSNISLTHDKKFLSTTCSISAFLLSLPLGSAGSLTCCVRFAKKN